MQPARLWVQEPIFRVLNSEHLYKRLLAEFFMGPQFSSLSPPPSLLDLGFPGPSCPPVGLAVNSGQLWVRLRGKGTPNSGGQEDGFPFSFLPPLLPHCAPCFTSKAPSPRETTPSVASSRLPALSTPGVWKLQALSKQSSFVNQSSGLGLKQ